MNTYYIVDIEAEMIVRVSGKDAKDALYKYLKKSGFISSDTDTEDWGIAEANFNGYVIENFADLESIQS